MSPARMARIEEAIRIAADFVEAFNRHDVGRILALCGEDCVFEDFRMAADGGRHSGKSEIDSMLKGLFGKCAGLRMEVEELVGFGPRCCLRWKLSTGSDALLHGMDIFTVRNGLIRERLSYAKWP